MILGELACPSRVLLSSLWHGGLLASASNGSWHATRLLHGFALPHHLLGFPCGTGWAEWGWTTLCLERCWLWASCCPSREALDKRFEGAGRR